MANNEYLSVLAEGELERLRQAYGLTKEIGDAIVDLNGKLKAGEGAIISASKVSETNKAIEGQILTMKELVDMEKALQKEADNYVKLQIKLEKQAEARAKAEQKAAEDIIKAKNRERKADEDYQKQIERTAEANTKRLLQIQKETEKEVEAVFKLNNAYKQLETIVKINTEEGKRLAAQYGLTSKEFLNHEASTARYRQELARIDGALNDGRKNVGNYASSMFELTQVLRELPSAANGFPIFLQAIGNNLPQLQQKFVDVRKEVGSTGKALSLFATGLFSASNIFTLAMSAIIIGVTYFSRFSKETEKATKETNEFEKAQKELSSTVGKEIAQLQILSKTASNTALSYKERGDAVDKLQKEFPDYFSNLSREKILQGDIADAINLATAAILRNARAKAIQGKLEKEYAALIDAQLQQEKLRNNDPNNFNYAGEEVARQLEQEIAFRNKNIAVLTQQMQLEKQEGQEVLYFADEKVRKEYEALQKRQKAGALLTESERKQLKQRQKDYEDWLKKVEEARENIRNIARSKMRPDTSQELDPYAQGVNNTSGNNSIILDAIMKSRAASMQKELDDMDARNNQRILGIENSYLNGLYKSYADYEKAKTDAVEQGAKDRFEIEKRYLEEFIALLPIDSAERAKYQKQLTEVELKFKQQLTADKKKEDNKERKDSETAEKTRLKNIKKYAQEAYQAIGDIFGEIGNLLNAQAAVRYSELDKQREILETNAKAEIESIERSKQSEEEKQKEIQRVEGETANERKRLDNEELQMKQRMARFDKAANIANIIGRTALAVITAFAEGDPYTKIARAAIAGAAGAAQLAVAIAAPIPQYAQGTENHKGGNFIAGEAGEDELIVEPSGKAYWSGKKAKMFNAPRGTRVIPESKLMSSVANLSTNNLVRRSGNNVLDLKPVVDAIRANKPYMSNQFIVQSDNIKIRMGNR